MFFDFRELDAAYRGTRFESNFAPNAMLIGILFVVIWMWLETG